MKNTRAANKFKKIHKSAHSGLLLFRLCRVNRLKAQVTLFKVFKTTETQIFTIATIDMKPISELFVFGALSV
jgi:hypothetical protein